MLGEEGQVCNQYEYNAFGEFTRREETVPNRFGFAGEQFDAATDLYYLRARFYNPVIGRFLQEDTYYGDGLNLYTYCHNNPVGYVDPSGHAEICPEKRAAVDELMKKGISEEEALAEYQKYRDLPENKGLSAEEVSKIIVGKKLGLIPGKEGVVTGGSSAILGKNIFNEMGLDPNSPRTGYQAQHIIPKELRDHPVIKK